MSPPLTGRHHFRLAWRLSWWAWGVGLLSRVALYARPTPYGGAYVRHWDRYFFHSAFYGLMGVFALALPFLVWWALRADRPARRGGWAFGALTALLALSVGVDHFDHETQRFMGLHATPSFVATYGRIGQTATISDSFATDQGGAWLPFVLLGLLMGAVVAGAALLWRRRDRPVRPRPRWLLAAGAAAPVVAVLIAVWTPGGKFRMRKVQPYLMTVAAEWSADLEVGQRPADLADLVAEYQREWLATSADPAWRFPDPARPFLRVPNEPALPPPDGRWNVILVQTETLRGWDVGHLHPERATPSATPTLDRMAREGAAWSRFYTFGPPTVTGFLSGHCAITPHSRHNITTRYTYTALYCLPQLLRDHGYRAEYFTGSDPDWDGQAVWLQRWFDAHHFYRDADERDDVVFARAADRILELGRAGPFMATVVSITNHYPFKTRDPAYDVAGHDTVGDRILNTIHYTDAVLGDFLDRLRGEPWFERTLVVVYGDHGYNLGEHDGTPGQRNGYRESTWSPLIIYGAHPRLRGGMHDDVATLLDVAPTVASLLGFRQAVPWQGFDLSAGPRPDAALVHTKNDITFAETPRFSFVVERDTGAPKLFEADDLLQTTPIQAQHPEVPPALEAQAQRTARLVDYLVETDAIWRAPPR